jgi:1-deoxy-D-xylulose-5-phosphate reductoisomerase
MKNNILILGSTGKLGTKLLDYCFRNNLQISAITCYSNTKKIQKQKIRYNIKNSFSLSIKESKTIFLDYLKNNKFSIVYFLDYGSYSLKYLNIVLNNNTKCILAIANKELLIAGGSILIKKINLTRNSLIPLDSEHFSLINANNKNNQIKKLYITASGGPFYFKKNLNLNNVTLNQVLAHPKWSMGINNSIDSSNFINKILEIYEMSSIYKIDLEKINFVISKEAFVHSIIIYKDNTILSKLF